MSAPITEAHLRLANQLVASPPSPLVMATLIADSEAEAVQTAMLREYGNLCATNESLAKECDQLRAEVERLKADGAASAFINMSCRASRAETDRNNLRADLDAIKAIMNEEKARADWFAAALANIRALAKRRNKQDHSHDTTHQLVASLDQSLDIVQAELVEERWLKGCAIKRSQELLSELAAERARLDWLMAGGVCMMQAPGGFYISRLHAHVSRAAIDAAMKEGK